MAAGVDGLNSTFVKKCIDGVSRPVTEIFKESLRTKEIPQDWKDAYVTAILRRVLKRIQVIIDQLVKQFRLVKC